MSFRVERNELEYGEDIGTLYLEAEKRRLTRPGVLPLSTSGISGWKRARITAELMPGIYVISVAVAASEGGVRYNFRVLVE